MPFLPQAFTFTSWNVSVLDIDTGTKSYQSFLAEAGRHRIRAPLGGKSFRRFTLGLEGASELGEGIPGHTPVGGSVTFVANTPDIMLPVSAADPPKWIAHAAAEQSESRQGRFYILPVDGAPASYLLECLSGSENPPQAMLDHIHVIVAEYGKPLVQTCIYTATTLDDPALAPAAAQLTSKVIALLRRILSR